MMKTISKSQIREIRNLYKFYKEVDAKIDNDLFGDTTPTEDKGILMMTHSINLGYLEAFEQLCKILHIELEVYKDEEL